jgi:hypothetical protein
MRTLPIVTFLLLTGLAVQALAQPAPSAPTGGSAWPTAISDRPYGLNQGMLEVHSELPVSGEGGQTYALLGIGASYGLSDAIELGGDYAFQVSPSTDAAGLFAGHIRIRLLHNEKVSASVGGSLFYSSSLSRDGITLGAGGLSLRYRLNKQLSIFTDSNLCGGCVNVAGPVMGQVLVFHYSNSGTTGSSSQTVSVATLPVGVGFQASPQLYVSAATVVAGFVLSPTTDSALAFRDIIPIIASAWISVSPKLDIGASLTDDLKDAGNSYFIELGAKMFL